MKLFIIVIFFASCSPKESMQGKMRLGENGVIVKQRSKKNKLTPPKNHREAHVFKYTDLYINAQLAGKNDSAAYYLNLAMKYDSIYKINRHQ